MSAAALREAATKVAAAGTDPDELAVVVTWCLGSGRHPDALRRRVLEREGPALRLDLDDASRAPRDRPAARLTELAGPPAPPLAGEAREVLVTWHRRAVRVSLVGDPAYPRALARGWPHVDAPTWLAVAGEHPADATAVALVGARRATGYGTGVAAWLAEAAGDAGVRVVSGGAIGIDAAAHDAAAATRGGTTVVLGCGHDVGYPRPHTGPGGLFARVLEGGGAVLSENLPGAPPRAHRIRARNRIVAGLVDTVVVVEGGATSGALLTATAALDRDRTVLAVPGDVRAAGSVAPHRLLAEGAAPCTGPPDLLETLAGEVGAIAGPEAAGDGARSSAKDPTSAAAVSCLPPPAHAVLVARWPRPVTLQELAVESGLPVASLLAGVTRGKVSGELAEGADGVRLRRAPA